MGAWEAQSVECLTFDFGSGHDLMAVGSSLALGSMLGVDPAWASLSPSAFLYTLVLFLPLKKRKKKRKKEREKERKKERRKKERNSELRNQ